MAERKFIQSGGTAITIESPGAASPGDAALAPKFVAALKALAKSVGDGFKDVKDGRPDEISVAFHLGVGRGGQFVILQGEADANFNVSFKWGGGAPSVQTPTAPYLP
jgi:hypothetical protein